jgi:hypothetical protein
LFTRLLLNTQGTQEAKIVGNGGLTNHAAGDRRLHENQTIYYEK